VGRLPGDGQALGTGWLGRLRLLPLALPLVLGLRLHLVGTLHGLPVAFALANPTTDEREVLVELLDVEPGLLAERPGLVLLVDKGDRDAQTEAILAARGTGAAASLQGCAATARPAAVGAVAAAHRVGQ
jgi:hypothetical protein